MQILRYMSRWNGVESIIGCYNSRPTEYPPLQLPDEEPLIYNNDPSIYATHETSGVKFYNSAIYKDTSTGNIYAIIITRTASNAWTYLEQHGYYSGGFTSNRVYNTIAQTQYWSSADNLATFNSDLPVFTDYQEYYDYCTNLQNPPPTYVWHSVKSVSGKQGTYEFTALPDEMLTGDSVLHLERGDFETWSNQTELGALARNLIALIEMPVIYSGISNYMSVKITNLIPYTAEFKFYVLDTVVWSFTYNISMEARLAIMIDHDNAAAKAALVVPYDDAGFTKYNYTVFVMTTEEMQGLYLWLIGSNPEDDPNYNGDDEGEGVDPWHETPIEGLSEPGKSAIATGFTKMYEVSDTQLKNLSDYLWSNNFLDNVKKFFNDPREIIVGLSIMPLRPMTGASEEIRAGNIDTGVYGLPLTSQYRKVDDFGSIYIQKEKGNFLDHPPYTKITAHLPYVGEHSLDVNDVMGHTLTLSYIFDFLTGSCVAQIAKDGNPRYFFGGSCGVQIPTSSEDFGRMYSSILSAGATVGATLATIATGGMALPAAVAAGTAAKGALTAGAAIGAGANTAQNLMNMTPNVEFSSGSGSINGLLSAQTAYLIVETPNEKVAGGQSGFTGRPSYTSKQLSTLNGYVKCLSVHLDKFGGTDTERNAVESALLSGVRFENGNETPEYTQTTPEDQAIIFLKCTSDRDVIGKSWKTDVTDDIKTVEGKLLFDKNILSPVFVIENVNIFDYNYAYIPLFKRFYYIKGMTVKTGSMIEVSFECDPGQSFRTDIIQNTAIIERAQSKYNAYFNDSEYWTLQSKTVKVIPFQTSDKLECLFDRSNNTYILTLAGG